MKKLFITQPDLPPLEEFNESLAEIWKSRYLTNQGPYHNDFERRLAEYLGVEHLSLFANGTLALIVSLQVLRITGEVITTPFSFVATAHSLLWNGITPVFSDIDPVTLNLDPAHIEKHITPDTTAIMPVHVYGTPCDMDEIQRIADVYGLKVIYDAAHAFGVKQNGCTVLNQGDLSILSFHATKTFNTVEGGAIICRDEKTKKRIDYAKNFGFVDEVTVAATGINGKMNELQAAFGILQLKYIRDNIAKRRDAVEYYRKNLEGHDGVRCLQDISGIDHNYAYFPIFIDEHAFGRSRDALYRDFIDNDIMVRRYFYPLISEFPMYRDLPSASPDSMPVAVRTADEVLCLPVYSTITRDDLDRVLAVIFR